MLSFLSPLDDLIIVPVFNGLKREAEEQRAREQKKSS